MLGWAWLHSNKGREVWPAVLWAWLGMVGLFFCLFVWNDSRPLLVLQHALAKKQKQKNIYKYITVVHGFLGLLFSIIDFFCLFSLVFIIE